ncbi:hypothetical protein [Cryptosporidium parvum Iowa II]|uniref:Uncharacterized protein n=2 Tax=Cryptosporidium parvum TaxID=5807 RepID=Q5CUD4_CRYPI|nr:hypothetical protein [Cryptosporidium parvum Iowa II]EAK89011.1 hypothetical protein with possible signal peptide and one transmembrane region [Cryptosporidium parvum Iowa II]QOY42682.1 Uncharacterized protein CPATCC_0034300 [Cryptosporidium parvum]WKS77078.1 putative signal peptide-containing protein-like and one transmembrane-like region [Cryptosporidium sp. 43IA8]WRK31570.1 Uncharacterized protein cpbgf_3003290 [Cryptosporidium parvum]|eukprot:QOY42682.1 hypothetical protein CPATCC_001347 [Cryptosporidium parvum]
MRSYIKIIALFFSIIAFNINFEYDLSLNLLSNHAYSFVRTKKNAWDIVNENHEIFNSPGRRANGELSLSSYKWNISYDQPFSSQISQVILVILVIVLLICVILSLICCRYSVPKEEDFTKKEDGIYYFENEKRPEEFALIYNKNAQNRRYILTGETPKNIEYCEDQD